jgi:putative ABC transport system permease protein
LWGNKTRTVLVVMSIAVGVFAVGVIASTQMLLSSDLSSSYAATDPSSAALFVSGMDEDTVATVRHMPGVREAEGRKSVNVRLKVGEGEWRTLNLDAIEKYNDQKLSKVRPVSGAWPPSDKEFLIERASIALANAQVGDKVTVELADGKLRELRIAGIAHDLNKPPAMFTGSPYGYISFDTLEWLGFPRNFDDLRILVDGNAMDKKHVEAVAEDVKKKLEKGGLTVGFIWIPTPGKHPADDAVQPMLLILGALGSLSLFLSGFLVVNTISALLLQQTRQIGIMKAIGAQTRQIMGLYLSMVVVFGILALLVAVPLGALGAWAFVGYLASLINFDLQGYRIPPTSLAMQVAVGMLVPLIASLWPILAGARVSVREALSSYGLGKGAFGTNFIDKALERIRGLSRPTLISLRNTFRRKARLALTLFTLTLGGAVFIAVLSVHASLLNTLDGFFNYWRYDLDIAFSRPYRSEMVTREALNVPGVVAAETWALARPSRVRPNGDDGRSITLIGVPPETQMLNPKLMQGRWLLPDDENAVVINTAVQEADIEPDIKVGDDVTFKIEGREGTWRVVGVAQAVLTGPLMYANRNYLERVSGDVGRASSIQLITDDHSLQGQTALGERVKEHYKTLGVNVRQTEAIASIRQQIEYQFNILVVFLAIMAILLAIVGGLGLMGTMSINVLERTREIGVMRAIGASDGSVLRIFLVEGIFVGLLSWFVGAIMALPISQILSQAVGVAFLDAPLDYVFSVNGALVWLVIVLILASLASLLPSWHASRLTVRDVLAYE